MGFLFSTPFPRRTGGCWQWQWLWRNVATDWREPSIHLSSGLTKKPCLSQSGQTSEFPCRPFSWRCLTVFLLTDPTLGTSDPMPFSVSSCPRMPPQRRPLYYHRLYRWVSDVVERVPGSLIQVMNHSHFDPRSSIDGIRPGSHAIQTWTA